MTFSEYCASVRGCRLSVSEKRLCDAFQEAYERDAFLTINPGRIAMKAWIKEQFEIWKEQAMKPSMCLNTATEEQEQHALMQWAEVQSGKHPELQLLYHIPNEGKRSAAAGRRLIAAGLKRGVPDICLPVPRGEYHGLYIELKRRKGGVISVDQKRWIRDLAAQGYMAEVCRGWEEAAEVLVWYLGRLEGKA